MTQKKSIPRVSNLRASCGTMEPIRLCGLDGPAADLRSLFEAARWAASSDNEQPWNFLVATKGDPEEFGRIPSCLVETNQAWAKAAPVLALGVFNGEWGNPSPLVSKQDA